jgi:hypothetical protein
MEFELKEVVGIAAGGISAVVGWLLMQTISAFCRNLADTFKELTVSVKELNVNMAKSMERLEAHERRLDRLENR